MKTKIIVLVGIAFCTMLLVSPTLASDAGTLEIYGNANEDDTIDMRDLTYVKLIFFGKKPETELADAKYDGEINPLDFIQIKLIIVGKEKELTIVDSTERVVTAKKPLERIVVTFSQLLELLQSIKIEKDRIVGIAIPEYPGYNELFFPELIDLPSVGTWWGILDCEAVLNLHPDNVLLIGSSRVDATQDVLESAGITVIRFYAGVWGEDIVEETKKLGYLFDKQHEAEDFVDFYNKHMNSIKEKVEEISEEDKPKVYFELQRYKAGSEMHARCDLAGGKNIFPKGGSVDPEAIIEQNTDIIVKALMCSGGYHIDADDTAELKKVRDEIMSRPELKNVKAVKEGRVYVITGYVRYSMGCAGCKGFLQTAYMAKWFHPYLFEDIDPKAIHQEYLTRFHRLDIDLDEKGVFVYPPFED